MRLEKQLVDPGLEVEFRGPPLGLKMLKCSAQTKGLGLVRHDSKLWLFQLGLAPMNYEALLDRFQLTSTLITSN